MWFLESSEHAKIQAMYSAKIDFAGKEPPAPQAVKAEFTGSTAVIPIKGILVPESDPILAFFGVKNTSYKGLIEAVHKAEGDPDVDIIQLDIDSPGGSVEGLFEAVAAIESTRKPVVARVSNKAASAAYWIASQADEIIAKDKATIFGSIGVVQSQWVSDNVVEITSTNAPNKRPDVTTEEGKKVVRAELDALHELMAESIANGRGVTIKKVNTDFGKGGTFLAEEALKRGMIDAIGGSDKQTGGQAASLTESKLMNLAELKAKHPELYQAAFDEGVTKERDRASAHLKMGEASGAVDIAVKAVIEGSDMTASIQADYMAASINKIAKGDRAADDIDATAADGADISSTKVNADDEYVLTQIEARVGV